MTFWKSQASAAGKSRSAQPIEGERPCSAETRRRRSRFLSDSSRRTGSWRRCRIETLETRQLLAAEVEPNDTIAQATLLPAGDLAEGVLSGATDVDYFQFNLAQGERFSLNPFNQNAPRFSSTLPPGLELFDDDGNLLATSHDGSDLGFVAPAAGTYYLGISSSNAFGTFVGDYGMQSQTGTSAINTEPEPNGPESEAPEIALGIPINGTLDGGGDIDQFSINTQPGDVVVVSFAGLPLQGPATELIDGFGNVIASDTTGKGLSATIRNGGTITLRLQRSDALDVLALEYNMVVNVLSDAFVAEETGSELSGAYDWQLDRPSGLNNWQQQVAGTIEDVDDVDVFRFEIDSLSTVNFRLALSGSDAVTGDGKSMTLYNQYGQFLADTHSNTLSTSRPDAFAPGVYYLAVSANSPIGVGAYGVLANFQYNFSPQRDATTHVFDFDDESTYFGFDRVAAYAVDEARPYYIGSFNAKYAPYDVNAVTEAPADGNERITQGIGDFGDFGAGGLGSSRGGQRSANGLAMTGATETSVGALSALSTNTVNHEFGHAAGLPHARDVQAFMSYVGRTEYLSTGSIFAFEGTDSRQPGSQVNNHRNYIDWNLQAGAQVIVEETRDSDGNEVAVSLDRYLQEMTIDHQVSQTIELEQRPVFVRAGDFDGDGRDDVVSLQQGSNQLHTYLSAADGTLGEAVATEITSTFNFATEPISIGDFNNDGRDDVAIGMSSEAQVLILLAGAGGVLAAGTPLTTSGSNSATTTADLDGDGNLDIATTSFGGQLTVFLGDGDGTFGEAAEYTTVASPSSLDAGDYNGDGNLDLLVASNASASVSLHRNAGFGSFVRGDSVEITEFSTGIAVADFNNDTASDFAVVSGNGALLEIYQSFGNGEFGLLASESMTNEPHEISADDIDGDGAVDLLVGGWRYSASVLLGDNEGGFTRPVWTSGTNWNEYSIVAADLDGTGPKEFITADANNNALTVSTQSADNPQNDKVVVFASLEGVDDVDRYTFDPTGETVWDVDIDSAEFQMPLDAILTIRDGSGNVIARSDDAVDRQSGIVSVDPYIRLDFGGAGLIPAGPLTIEVTGRNGSSASYRMKLTPGSAMETAAPRVIGISPDNGAVLNTTNQILVLLDDIIDSDTINTDTVRVTNASGQRVSGSARVNPLAGTLVWTATLPLPVGTYTVTLDGIADFNGNTLDGEVAADFAFPLVSGNGTEGGAFTSTFTIASEDVTPVSVFSVNYSRDPYQRGQFTLGLTDQLSLSSVRSSAFTLHGAGGDLSFGTADDTFQPLDAVYDSIAMTRRAPLTLYTRGIPDSGMYRIEGRVTDGAGYTVNLSEEVAVTGTVPAAVLYQDAAGTQPGLVGSYVDASLRDVAAVEDWRETQTIAGTRVDESITFVNQGDFGSREEVGVTGGTDDNWDNFSVQWDGYIAVPEDGVQLLTRSDDGSRVFVDIDGNGVFGNTAAEIADNGWGSGHGYVAGSPSAPLLAGTYAIRIQYEEASAGEAISLEWIRPTRAVDTLGLVHGPAIVGTSLASGTHRTDPGLEGGTTDRLDSFSVTFSGSIDPETLTTDNLRLRRSDDSLFFDPFDDIIEDADGIVQWNATTFTATLNFAEPLQAGFYLLEANGELGGIANTAGSLLDGEFLSNHIPGNTDAAIWTQTPSGDGIAGGTYRSTFSYSPPRLAVDVQDVLISEKGGTGTVTVSRLFADTSEAMIVNLSSSDRTELTVPPNVTIPAGAESVTFIVNAIDDTLFDGTQHVTITARAAGIEPGDGEIGVTDYESLLMALADLSISERGGATELILNRIDASVEQTIFLSVDDTSEASISTSVTFEEGQRTIRVPITALDDEILDGTQFVTITSSGVGLVDESIDLAVTDYETLAIELDSTSVVENGGTITGVLHRSDPNGNLTAQLFSEPSDALTQQLTVTFLSGSTTSLPFELTTRDNTVLDGSRFASIIASAGGYVSANTAIEILDYEPLSIVFDDPASPVEISEKDGVAVVRVRRTDSGGALEGTLSVDPSGGISFASAVHFVDGELLSSPIELNAIDDDFLTGTRTFVLTASAPDYVDTTAEMAVSDYEELSTQLVRADGSAINDNTVLEDAETVFVRVSLPRAVTFENGPLDVAITTTSPQSVEIPASVKVLVGQSFVDVPVDPVDNEVVGGNRSFQIIADATGYQSSEIGMTINEDDVPEMTAEMVLPIGQAGASQNTLPESNGAGTLVLTRNTISEVTVRLSTSPTEQLTWPTLVTFPRGHRRIEIPIATRDNDVVDGDRPFTLTVRATGHPTTEVTSTIVDDEVAGLVVLDEVGQTIAGQIRLTESTEGLDASSKTLGLTLASAPLSDVRLRVNAPTRLGVEVNDSQATELTFTPFDWDVPQEVRVFALDDSRASGDESSVVSIEVIDNDSDEHFRGLSPKQLEVVVVDNDRASILINETFDNTYASELGLPADSFSVALGAQPTAPVTLTFDNSAIDSVEVSPSTLTFTPENWNIAQTVDVVTDLDFDADGHDIGLIYLDVSESTLAYGYPDIGRRRLSVIHVDAELSDLHVRRVDDEFVLVDEATGTTLITQAVSSSVFTTGLRGETITVDPDTGAETIALNTSGGDDHIMIGSPTRVTIDGSLGYDTLHLDIDGFEYSPATIPAFNADTSLTVRNIEEINTVGDGTQTLVIDSGAVQALTDSRNILFLRVDATDFLDLGDGWSVDVPVLTDGVPAHQLTSNGATLRLAASAIWQNPLLAPDVNRSGGVSSLDPLLIINRLNQNGEGELPDALSGEFASELTGDAMFYYDVSGDGIVSALDALQAINYLNAMDAAPAPASEPVDISPTVPVGMTTIVVSGLPTSETRSDVSDLDSTETLWDESLAFVSQTSPSAHAVDVATDGIATLPSEDVSDSESRDLLFGIEEDFATSIDTFDR